MQAAPLIRCACRRALSVSRGIGHFVTGVSPCAQRVFASFFATPWRAAHGLRRGAQATAVPAGAGRPVHGARLGADAPPSRYGGHGRVCLPGGRQVQRRGRQEHRRRQPKRGGCSARGSSARSTGVDGATGWAAARASPGFSGFDVAAAGLSHAWRPVQIVGLLGRLNGAWGPAAQARKRFAVEALTLPIQNIGRGPARIGRGVRPPTRPPIAKCPGDVAQPDLAGRRHPDGSACPHALNEMDRPPTTGMEIGAASGVRRGLAGLQRPVGQLAAMPFVVRGP